MTAGTMGADVANDLDLREAEIHAAGMRAMRQRAAELRGQLCQQRGLEPSQACAVCRAATPSPCEACVPPHWLPSDDTEGGDPS